MGREADSPGCIGWLGYWLTGEKEGARGRGWLGRLEGVGVAARLWRALQGEQNEIFFDQ